MISTVIYILSSFILGLLFGLIRKDEKREKIIKNLEDQNITLNREIIDTHDDYNKKHAMYQQSIRILSDREVLLAGAVRKLSESNREMDDLLPPIDKSNNIEPELTIDEILDKISKFGIQSLTEKDKEVLKKSSK